MAPAVAAAPKRIHVSSRLRRLAQELAAEFRPVGTEAELLSDARERLREFSKSRERANAFLERKADDNAL
jgi:hypothetical protein